MVICTYFLFLGYTFFVPTDDAFEQQGLANAPDNFLSTGTGLQVLLSHFIKGRLYDRDLKNNSSFTSLGNSTLHMQRTGGEITSNSFCYFHNFVI